MRKPATPQAESIPVNLRAFAPFFTTEIVDAAVARVILGEVPPKEFTKQQKKLCYLLVRALNPDETLHDYEEAILRGVTRNTLTGMKQRGEVPPVCGGISTHVNRQD